MTGIAKPIGQIVGDRDRVKAVCVLLKWAGYPDPCAGDPEDLTKNHPKGVHTNRVSHAGQAEKEPRTLSGSVRAERYYP